ncbi:LLM class flavin-dependent oxidoreductase [Microcella alkalica]|uniref:Putative LLM family oxidoreductase n=1 Tax=Microcella alkalica TaxID=355930 RepID=A0A839E8N3_9MICO|nr:LLM class flavin-dependent oxidoreductase [Microcella alkalica]MBA8847553.1 putative LLM family oxidoreductase [Microcella alkalica]
MTATIDPARLQFGLNTFGDVSHDAAGEPVPYPQVIRDVVAEGVLADQVGIDAFAIGEHHRDDYAVSAPDIVLAGIAARTERIRLSSAVTVLSSDDPIRVFQRFATIDAISNGRAEIVVGRGSFTESFPLFGFELADYQVLFDEKLNLLAEVLKEGPVTWSGRTRAPLTGIEVYPKTASGRIPTWVGVGGSPESVVRTAHYGMPMILAIIGGDPQRFAPYVDLYHRALDQMGKDRLPVGVHSPGFIADSDEEAHELFWPHYQTAFGRIGRERGWGPTTREHYDAEIEHGSLYVGGAETVARKIAATVAGLSIERFDLKYTTGPVPHSANMRAIELYGTQVIPMVRELVAEAVPVG